MKSLRYLAVLGELEILPHLFGEVFCLLEVLAECCHAGAWNVAKGKSPV